MVECELPGMDCGKLEGCALTAAQPTGIPCLTVASKNGTFFKLRVNDLLLLIHGSVSTSRSCTPNHAGCPALTTHTETRSQVSTAI